MNQPVDILVPSLGWSDVRISVWFAEPGDRVYAGDRIVELVGSGATFDVAAPVTGQLKERRSFARDVVHSGQVIGSVIAEAE